jgi:hypothetical protein
MPKASCTTRAARAGTAWWFSRDWPHQGMVSAKKIAVATAMATRRGERPSARIAPMATITTTKW